MVQAFCVTEHVLGDHRFCDPMIQNIILPHIGLAQEKQIKTKIHHTGRPMCFGNAIQGDHCSFDAMTAHIIILEIFDVAENPPEWDFRF